MSEIKIRLYPTAEQAAGFDKTFDCCRLLWNRMIADEGKLRAELGKHFIPTPAKYKREIPALKEVDSLALATVHQKLERAFQDHAFNSHDHPEPTTVAETASYTTFCQQTKYGPTIRFEEGGLKLPKIGSVKVELHRELPLGARIKSAVVSKSEEGYFCTLAYEAAAMPAAAAKEVPEKLPA